MENSLMKMSLSQMIAFICIFAVGFVSFVPFFLQEANAGADVIVREVYEVWSWKEYRFLGFELVNEYAEHTPHYTYYHYYAGSTAAWEHIRSYPNGHPWGLRIVVLGRKWV